MDEFGALDTLTNSEFSNVSKSVCKKLPLPPWSKNWLFSSNELNVRARRPLNSCKTSTSSLYGTNRVLARDYVLIQYLTKAMVRRRHTIHRPTRSRRTSRPVEHLNAREYRESPTRAA
jgi:hypothetical protein